MSPLAEAIRNLATLLEVTPGDLITTLEDTGHLEAGEVESLNKEIHPGA